MKILLIPVAPLSRAKSRLRNYFSKKQLEKFIIAMFTDLCNKLKNLTCFDKIIVYCNSDVILNIAELNNLTPIKEEVSNFKQSLDEVIDNLNKIAIEEFNATKTVVSFADLVLISPENFIDIANLIDSFNVVVCPAYHSAGISILGRNPPDIIPTSFSHPYMPSLMAFISEATKKNLKIKLYDSFRAGFDVDIKEDLVLAYEYLKAFNMTSTETFKFLKMNLNLILEKRNVKNNRNLRVKYLKSKIKKRM
ncbi:MAG: hypothetical protein ACTSUX_04065 [Promethearchaeota archaeon]